MMKHDAFSLLLLKKHRNLLSLQQTIGALNWFRKFIPNYSQLISPVYAALKAIRLYDLEKKNDTLDQICRPVILKVKQYLEKQQLLSHPSCELEKHLYLYVGEIAFASALWQKTSSGKLEFIEYCSNAGRMTRLIIAKKRGTH